MQIFIILLGVVLVLSGLYFAVGGFGQGKSGGGFKDIKMEGPPWLLLVAFGIGLVVFGAVWEWDEDYGFTETGGTSQGLADVPTFRIGELMWTTDTTDAGDLDWAEAQAFCADLEMEGEVFRLPTIAELQAIADPNDVSDFDYQINRVFHDGLGGNWVWSAETEGAGAARYLDFTNLSVGTLPQNFREGAQTLCVSG